MADLPEDSFLAGYQMPQRSSCVHDWIDLYGGGGVAKHDPTIALATFFCKKCLEIRIKSYSMERFHLDQEFLDGFEERE